MYHSVFFKDPNHPGWDDIWKIYVNSFPLHEQRQEIHQQVKMKCPFFNCQAFYLDCMLVGFIFWWEFGSYKYIEHLAVNPVLRGKNHGSLLLREFCKNTMADIILEIDPPDDDISKRRLCFYQSVGFVMNDYYHSHPPYQEGYQGHELRVLSYQTIINKNIYQKFNMDLTSRIMSNRPYSF